jgi:hypothetical protein
MDESLGAVLETADVAHVEPLTDDQLNQQISDTLPELFKHFHELGQRIATEFGMNGSDAIALLKLDAPMTMKELGQRMAHPRGRGGQGAAVPRDPGPGTVVHVARHQRATVPARADAEDAPRPVREVMLSQKRRL